MAKRTMMDMLHVSIFAPPGLQKSEYAAIYRTLNGPIFGKHLRRTIHATFRCYPALKKVRFTVTS